jgi:glycosyltransferase involved in cell wall biosynthesis
VPPKNPMALQNAMSRLLTDRSLCVQMGQAARAQIATRYDQQTLWRTILQAYQEALQSV